MARKSAKTPRVYQLLTDSRHRLIEYASANFSKNHAFMREVTRPAPLGPTWRPEGRLKWVGRESIGDYPSPPTEAAPIWSQRAAEALGPLLEGLVELVPVTVSGTPMVLVRILERDCVDRGASVLEPWGDDGANYLNFRSIKAWAFRSPPPILFRVPELPLRAFCTDAFREAVRAHGLKGFLFDPVRMKGDAKKKPAARKKKPAAKKAPARKTRGGPVTREALREALRAAAERFLVTNRKALTDETPYAFLFEVSDQSFHVFGALATEERLARFADGEAGGAAAYRWGSTEDGGWIQKPDSAFRDVNALLQRAVKAGMFQLFDEDGAFADLCHGVLRDLDAFGKGKARERVVLGMCDIGGPEVPGDLLPSVKAVNSPAVVKRFQREARACERAQEGLD